MGTQEAEAKNARTLEMFDRAIRLTPQKMVQEFRDIMTDLEAQGIKRAPVKEGFLRASIEKISIMVQQVAGRFRLDGGVAARTPYALKQHENLDYRHPKGGEAKYLSRPLKERAPMYREALVKAATQALKESRG